MNILVFAVTFVLVFPCSLVALERVEGFSVGARWCLAVCTALLSGLGLIAFVGDGPSLVGPDLLGLLLPHAALGATLIVLLLLLAVVSVHRSFRDALRRHHLRVSRRRAPREEPVTNRQPSIGDDNRDRRRP